MLALLQGSPLLFLLLLNKIREVEKEFASPSQAGSTLPSRQTTEELVKLSLLIKEIPATEPTQGHLCQFLEWLLISSLQVADREGGYAAQGYFRISGVNKKGPFLHSKPDLVTLPRPGRKGPIY